MTKGLFGGEVALDVSAEEGIAGGEAAEQGGPRRAHGGVEGDRVTGGGVAGDRVEGDEGDEGVGEAGGP